MSSAQHYLSDAASLEDLFRRMQSPDRESCMDFQHLQSEQCFLDRLFIVYKPTGLNSDNQHRPPEILTQVKVTDFRVNARTGAEVDLLDITTQQVMTVTYIPKRLFDYDAFVSVPPKQRLHWDARSNRGVIVRSMAFHLLVKVRTRADFYSAGATAVQTPSNFRELYPDVSLTLINK